MQKTKRVITFTKTKEIMKTYRLIYLTKENDTLREEIGEYFDIKDARKAAAVKLANSNLNDLVKIKVRKHLQNHK